MTASRTTRIPTPLYALAGAGDLAYRRLRRLPEVIAQLRDRTGEEPPALAAARARARAAYARAARAYSQLAAHGERVVAGRAPSAPSAEAGPSA
ncbi:MAG TPA: hypothetical protein VNV66_15350 [Pilimelia sp.]|nr:hypothetical protein [Pilimelia sp.]